MEGDAKGQVGGMEMPEKERRRLASESKSWRCQGCGGVRSNEDILREEGGEAGEGKDNEHVVPEELKFGFRDQMAAAGSSDVAKDKGMQVVSTPVPDPLPASASAASPPPTSSSPEAMHPTRTVPVASASHAPPSLLTATRQIQSDGVPAWVDKAITGLVAALAVMIIKKILL